MIVFAATRNDGPDRGTVGYFKTLADVPPEFKHAGEEDISGIMRSMRLTDVDQCLAVMNSHWQPMGRRRDISDLTPEGNT